MSGVANEVVDYMLFIDETKLTDRVRGASGFAERFSAGVPRTRRDVRCTSSISTAA